jgi:SAM-dependent methyltransferase
VREADAENLPFENDSFDAVMSVFGAMFTPNQDRTASEMLRVCKPGGRVALANWTPSGFIGELFRVVGRHVPPPAGVKPASLWGTEDRLRELFPSDVADVRVAERVFNFRYRSPRHWIDVFQTYYGPVLRAFAALPQERRGDLDDDLFALAQEHNVTTDGTFVAPGAYLEVVITKR